MAPGSLARSRLKAALSRTRATVAPSGSKRAAVWIVAATVLVGAMAATVLLSTTSRTSGSVGPGRVELHVGLGASRTALRLPPLGTIWADTHAGPVGLELRVDQIDVAEAQGLIAAGAPEDRLRQNVDRDLRPLAARLARKTIFWSAVVGAVGGALVPRRRWWSPLVGAGGGLLAAFLLLGATWQSFDAGAFEAAPVFEGPLEEAPRIVNTVLEHVEGIEDIRDRFDVLSAQVADLYSTNLGLDESPRAGETRILHVSDIHFNPVGLEVTRQLAEEFRVDAVLDTGDLTSFGQPFEAVIVPLVEKIGAPYFFAPGNHDSAANRSALADATNVTLLDGEMVRVGPVEILGVADPTFTATGELTHDEANEVLDTTSVRVRSLVVQHRPDLLAVHNIRMAAASTGYVPYVVAGHIHRTTSEEREGTLLLTVGSTGSTGLGEFTQTDDPRYEAEILRFVGSRLVAIDRVVLEGRRGDFQISREVVERTPLTPLPPRRGPR